MVENNSDEIAASALASRTFMEEFERIVKADSGLFDITAIVSLLESDQARSNLRYRRDVARAMADALGATARQSAIQRSQLPIFQDPVSQQ